MHNFKKLEIWKRSIKLTELIYKLTASFPKSEIYGLTSQIRRAAVSVPSNIVEGSSRNTNKDFARFLAISLGSLAELETQLIISRNLNFIEQQDFQKVENEVNEIQKMIAGFKTRLVSKSY